MKKSNHIPQQKKKCILKFCKTGVQIFDVELKRFIPTTLSLLKENFRPDQLGYSIWPLNVESMRRSDFTKVLRCGEKE